MGLRCLMGHDYGALQTEREREDMGEEAVVTVREFKECGRCGHRQIVSENKEVTATTTETPTDDRPTESEPSEAVERSTEFEDVSADEDDGVILDDAEGEPASGEWPNDPEEAEETDEADDSEHDPWPEVEAEDEGFEAEATDDEPADDVEFGGGLAPEATVDDDATDAGAEEPADESGPAGIRSVEPAGGQRSATVNATVVCPECDHEAPARGSSLRPGDICPECRRGYLVEREP